MLCSGAEGTRTADERWQRTALPRCGIYPFPRKRVNLDNQGINVFCLEGFDPSGIPIRQAVGAPMP